MNTGAATKRAKIPVPDAQPDRVQDQLQDPTPSQEMHDRIALRAYEIYEERGGEPGREVEDWLQAEQEVLGDTMDTDLG